MIDNRLDPETGLFLVKSPTSTESDSRQFRRESHHGTARFLRRGVAVTSRDWAVWTPRERYLARVRAVVETRQNRPVISHESAAALWAFPVIDDVFPASVHVLAPRATNLRSKNGVIVHRGDFGTADVAATGGILVTTPERTLLDIARTIPFAGAVAALDHALDPDRAQPPVWTTQAALLELLQTCGSHRGVVRATKAILFARPNAANVGESVSRVAIAQLGFPRPELQTRHRNPRGGSYYTDFEWPEFHVVGELDGLSKYVKPEYLHGMTPGNAVVKEKVREDDLRAEGNTVARWIPDDVRNPRQLFRILTAAGLPTVR